MGDNWFQIWHYIQTLPCFLASRPPKGHHDSSFQHHFRLCRAKQCLNLTPLSDQLPDFIRPAHLASTHYILLHHKSLTLTLVNLVTSIHCRRCRVIKNAVKDTDWAFEVFLTLD